MGRLVQNEQHCNVLPILISSALRYKSLRKSKMVMRLLTLTLLQSPKERDRTMIPAICLILIAQSTLVGDSRGIGLDLFSNNFLDILKSLTNRATEEFPEEELLSFQLKLLFIVIRTARQCELSTIHITLPELRCYLKAESSGIILDGFLRMTVDVISDIDIVEQENSIRNKYSEVRSLITSCPVS